MKDILHQILNELGELKHGQARLEEGQARLENRLLRVEKGLKAVSEQTAGLIEFRTETIQRLNEITEKQDIISRARNFGD